MVIHVRRRLSKDSGSYLFNQSMVFSRPRRLNYHGNRRPGSNNHIERKLDPFIDVLMDV